MSSSRFAQLGLLRGTPARWIRIQTSLKSYQMKRPTHDCPPKIQKKHSHLPLSLPVQFCGCCLPEEKKKTSILQIHFRRSPLWDQIFPSQIPVKCKPQIMKTCRQHAIFVHCMYILLFHGYWRDATSTLWFYLFVVKSIDLYHGSFILIQERRKAPEKQDDGWQSKETTQKRGHHVPALQKHIYKTMIRGSARSLSLVCSPFASSWN